MFAPVSQQPEKTEFGVSVSPSNLQCLAGLEQIIIKQKAEALEVLSGFVTRSRYAVVNNQGQQLLYVQEESDRSGCPPYRGLQLHVTDNNSQEVIQFKREFESCGGCCWWGEGCCSMSFNVESPVGRLLGRVRTGDSMWKTHMRVFDAADTHVYTLWSSCCPCQAVCCSSNDDFPITDASLKTRVGNVAKNPTNCCGIGPSQFSLSVPASMTVEHKTLLLGALFLAEYYTFKAEQVKQPTHG